MSNRKTLIGINGLCLIMIAGCGGQLYKVAPLPMSRAPEISTGNAMGLNIGATALDGERSVEQFEANLPLAGVIAVDVNLVNQSSGLISAKRLRFDLNDQKGFKQIQPKKALSKVIDYYGDSFYRVDARKRTQENYEAIALKLDGIMAPGDARRGILFYEADVKNIGELILTVTGAGAPVTVNVSNKAEDLQKITEQENQRPRQ
jgi:hypothetical protein